MGTYNTLLASLKCPRCGADVDADVDCYFGYVGEMEELRIGDRYPWFEGKQPQDGGRPAGGTVDGEGYMECPRCHKDAFLHVLVRDDVIVGVKPDTERQGYVPD